MPDQDLATMQAVVRGPVPPEIITAEAMLRVAQLAADVSALDELIADELLFTGPDGQLGTKAADLASHATGAVRVRQHEPEELRARSIAGAVVVTNLRTRMQVEVNGQLVNGVYRYTRVWAQEGGHPWRVVAGHVAEVHAAAPPDGAASAAG
jgi:ketosteroid isomerase-like protein